MLKLLICNFKYELSELKLCRFTTVFYNTRPSTLILFWTTLVHRKKIKFWIWQIFNGYKFWVLLLNTSLQMRTRYSQILNHMLINFVYMFIHDLYFVFITSCLICLNDNRVLFIYFFILLFLFKFKFQFIFSTFTKTQTMELIFKHKRSHTTPLSNFLFKFEKFRG